MSFLDGKKTYLTMIVMIILAVINGYNDYCATEGAADLCTKFSGFQVPEFIYGILAATGIYTRKVARV